MTFREKSAWAMGALTLVTGVWWLRHTLALPTDAPALAYLGPLVPYVLAVVVGSIAIQSALAVWMPREADSPADERERPLIDRAGNWSGVVLGVAMVTGAIQYLTTGQGGVLFQWVIGGLILSQLAEYAFQIALFRRGH